MTLERSLLDSDLRNVEEALSEAVVGLGLMADAWESGDGEGPFEDILLALERGQRELKAFRDRWEKLEGK